MTVDVIIPTYKPDQRFFELIALLDKQTYPISHIRIINTEEKYFEKIIYGRRYEEEYRNLREGGQSPNRAEAQCSLYSPSLPKQAHLQRAGRS